MLILLFMGMLFFTTCTLVLVLMAALVCLKTLLDNGIKNLGVRSGTCLLINTPETNSSAEQNVVSYTVL